MFGSKDQILAQRTKFMWGSASQHLLYFTDLIVDKYGHRLWLENQALEEGCLISTCQAAIYNIIIVESYGRLCFDICLQNRKTKTMCRDSRWRCFSHHSASNNCHIRPSETVVCFPFQDGLSDTLNDWSCQSLLTVAACERCALRCNRVIRNLWRSSVYRVWTQISKGTI